MRLFDVKVSNSNKRLREDLPRVVQITTIYLKEKVMMDLMTIHLTLLKIFKSIICANHLKIKLWKVNEPSLNQANLYL